MNDIILINLKKILVDLELTTRLYFSKFQFIVI